MTRLIFFVLVHSYAVFILFVIAIYIYFIIQNMTLSSLIHCIYVIQYQSMVIDNFDIIRSHLDFIDTKLDRYVVHILRRPKDISQGMKNALGANESQRLIKTYYVDSFEYFDRKKEAIKELCRANNARAYVLVQPKDNFECLINLGKKILDTIQNKNYSVKPEHLMREAYCEMHKTRKKQWILDLDDNEMYSWTREQVKELVKKHLKAIGKTEDDMYEVQTRHGIHVISSPFNLQKALEECAMLYEGVKSGNTLEDILEEIASIDMKNKAIEDWNSHILTPFNAIEWFKKSYGEKSIEATSSQKHLTSKLIKMPGWLHKDGMTILYMETNNAK